MEKKWYVAFWDYGAWNELASTRSRTRWLAEQLMKKLQPDYPPSFFEDHTLRVMGD